MCEGSLEQTDTGYELFPVQCKNVSFKKQTNIHDGIVSHFTAK